LHREYTPNNFYWELMEMTRRLLLVGLAVLVLPGSVVQLIFATMIAVLFLALQFQAAPYRSKVDAFLALIMSLSLVVLYIGSLVLKMGTLVQYEDVNEQLPPALLATFTVPSATLSFLLFVSLLAVIVITGVLLALQLARDARMMRVRDPRWDTKGFRTWATKGHVAFLKVGYLRGLVEKGGILPMRDELKEDAAYFGAPDSSVDIIAVDHGQKDFTMHPDPEGALLQRLVGVLNRPSWHSGPPQANDDDCVYWAYASLVVAPSTKKEKLAAAYARKEAHRIYTYYGVRMVIFPEAQETPKHGVLQYFEQGPSMATLALSAFCQRILNTSDTNVCEGTDPARLTNLRGMLDASTFNSKAEHDKTLGLLKVSLSKMLPVEIDRHGFRTVVHKAKVAFLRPGYIRLLARRHGPFPRRQDLKPEGVHDSVLPPGRMFSVSHGWASEMHPSPSGRTLQLLVDQLDKLGAHDEDDGVFLDYCSLPQKAHDVPIEYGETTGAPAVQADRDVHETRQFRFAMWEMSRLYAFFQCEVIVLPELESVAITHITPEGVAMSKWGRVNVTPYENRGWCAAEFSVAIFHGRVANADCDEVRRVMASRPWPRTVAQYAEMMDEDAEMPVKFTSNGDRAVVQFNFFKMCIGLKLQPQSNSLARRLSRRFTDISMVAPAPDSSEGVTAADEAPLANSGTELISRIMVADEAKDQPQTLDRTEGVVSMINKGETSAMT